MKRLLPFLALTVTMAASCDSDFIRLTPEDVYTAENFYKTEAQFRSAVIAAYAPLRDVLVNDYFTSEMHSDNTIYQPNPGNRGTAMVQRENISDFTNTSTNAYANATWQHSYTGIARCNIVIDRLPAASIPDAVKAELDGEVKFLRALNYFKLVRLYGGVPLFLHEIIKADDAFKERASVDQVYEQIIADASDAIRELNAPAAFPQTGRATKGAATVLLAEVYMVQQRWSEAAELLGTLPAMGYELNGNYADAFSPTNKSSSESIFDIQFAGGIETGATPNPLTFHFLPRSTNTQLLTGISINNTGTGGWNTPSQDLIEAFEPGDTRLDASIGIIEGTYNASDYLAYSAVKSAVDYTPSPGMTGVPYIKKYLHAPLPAITGSSDNFPIYRYSDALLLLAEALNEQGRSGEALTPLNTVRTRAGLLPITTTDQSELRDLIFHERRVELAFENHRWTDLVRTDQALEVVNAFGEQIKVEQPFLASDAYVIDEHHLLFPVPQGEVDINPQITQNPGYF